MEWALDKESPLSPQICQALSVEIAAGTYPPGSKLPSVREVAQQAGVNPNTVQKSFAELERQGLIRSVRSVGWFVCDNTQAAQAAVLTTAKEKTADYIRAMRLLGLSDEDICRYVKECMQ